MLVLKDKFYIVYCLRISFCLFGLYFLEISILLQHRKNNDFWLRADLKQIYL